MAAVPPRAEVVIIGGGILGFSCAAALALKGCTDVLLLERHPMPGLESTGKNAGGVRAQFASEVNVRFSLKSIELLESFERDHGIDPHFEQVGYLFCTTDPERLALLRGNAERQRALGVDTQELTPAQIAERVPAAKADDLVGGTFWGRDGILDTAALLGAYGKLARDRGVQVALETEVTGITVAGGRVRAVATDRGTVETDWVVNAAGPWAGQIGGLAGVEVPVQPWRRQVVVTHPLALADPFPMVVDLDTGLYTHKESQGLLLGWADPDQPTGFHQAVDEAYSLAIIERGMHRLPLLEEATILTAWAGLYETTPDHHGIVGEARACPGFCVAAGFSGHGVMHAPAVGLAVAELIVDGRATTLDAAPLRLERFAEGTAREERYVI